jgi:hypothetical protein
VPARRSCARRPVCVTRQNSTTFSHPHLIVR